MSRVDARRYVRFYYFCRGLCKLIIRLFAPIELRGGRHLPLSGSAIIACNHVSYIDPPAVGSATRRRLRYLAKAELFKYRWSNWLLRRVGAIPVKRGEVDLESIRAAIECLKQGEALLLFPEGTRSADGKLGSPNAGVAMLAKRSDAMVIPACVIGTRKMYPPGARFFRRSRIVVVFGEPIRYGDLEKGQTDSEVREQFGIEVMRRISDLLAVHQPG